LRCHGTGRSPRAVIPYPYKNISTVVWYVFVPGSGIGTSTNHHAPKYRWWKLYL